MPTQLSPPPGNEEAPSSDPEGTVVEGTVAGRMASETIGTGTASIGATSTGATGNGITGGRVAGGRVAGAPSTEPKSQANPHQDQPGRPAPARNHGRLRGLEWFGLGAEDVARQLLVMLWVADGLLIALFLASCAGLIGDPGFLLTNETCYGETSQHLKLVWIVAMLASLAWQRRSHFAWCMAGLFAFFLADDYGGIHQRLGKAMATWLPQETLLSLKTQHWGELLVFTVYAGVAGAAIWSCFPRHGSSQRRFAWRLLVILMVLGICGGGLDALQSFPWPVWIGHGVSAMEEGGELLAMSLAVACVFREWCGPRRHPSHGT